MPTFPKRQSLSLLRLALIVDFDLNNMASGSQTGPEPLPNQTPPVLPPPPPQLLPATRGATAHVSSKNSHSTLVNGIGTPIQHTRSPAQTHGRVALIIIGIYALQPHTESQICHPHPHQPAHDERCDRAPVGDQPPLTHQHGANMLTNANTHTLGYKKMRRDPPPHAHTHIHTSPNSPSPSEPGAARGAIMRVSLTIAKVLDAPQPHDKIATRMNIRAYVGTADTCAGAGRTY
ncbi:hypothetical protein BD410DRAFT_903299 [Rickenella mellea]|uniref:Uncharacterized protein n=1 Tax=Rickenella mellea TaxID=50990 RepID=A0A4Y7PDU5_9AGAM|nr:hypothetical protein BD410DRAFT_903299 [Rickenella mellea]